MSGTFELLSNNKIISQCNVWGNISTATARIGTKGSRPSCGQQSLITSSTNDSGLQLTYTKRETPAFPL